METALLILAIWFAIAGAAVWLDRRAANRHWVLVRALDGVMHELGMFPAEPLAELEPSAQPEPAQPCPVRRDNMRCSLLDGHQGDHSSRTGVSWKS